MKARQGIPNVLGSAATRDLLEPWPDLRDYVTRGEARPAAGAVD